MQVDFTPSPPSPPMPETNSDSGHPIFYASAETTQLACDSGAPADSYRLLFWGFPRWHLGRGMVDFWGRIRKFIDNREGNSLSRKID